MRQFTFSRKTASGIAVLLAGIACIRIITTYHVFCQTADEPAHIAAGMEWLDRGTYTYEILHPPLARVAVAVGPFLAGVRLTRGDNMWEEGINILYARGEYSRDLALARLGVLPFFLLAGFVVYAWSRSLFGDAVAATSVFVFTMLPPILGHAGLATTDMLVAAACAAALYAFTRWLDQPNVTRSLVLGLAVALAVLSKFTALVFLPASGLALLGWRCLYGSKGNNQAAVRRNRRVVAIGLTTVGACLVIWAGYRFSFRSLASVAAPHYQTLDAFTGPSGPLHDLAHFAVGAIPIPAPELFLGIFRAEMKNIGGNRTYLLGRIRQGGCWYFFLVALAVKSPITFLILVSVGVLFLAKRLGTRPDWRPLAPAVAAASVLLVTMPVRLHFGVRHILVVYPLLAIVAGFGATALWKSAAHRRPARVAVTLLLGWLVVSSGYAHPDYLPYFNELAGSHPERILVDSDLDWGQDLLRLEDALRARKVDKLALSYFGTADLSRLDLPPFTQLVPYRPTTGWIAISMFKLKMSEPEGAFSWLEAYKPVALIGRSIQLYNIPEKP